MEFLDILEDDSLYQSTIKEHLKERKIIVNETIDDNVIENICLMIMKWNKEDKALPASCRKPIYLYLNSSRLMISSVLVVVNMSKGLSPYAFSKISKISMISPSISTSCSSTI